MKKKIEQAMQGTMATFKLPRYAQLPDTGLYLEQTAKYINHCLKPLGCIQVTGSMIRNYVKMGLVRNPVKKQYYAEHISHLIPITILKQVLPLERINTLFPRQTKVYSEHTAYDYFCMELENVLFWRFGLKEGSETVCPTQSMQKEMLRSAIIAVSHIIFLDACFEQLKSEM